jgi:uncharacterized protein (TIGR03067 family)
MNIRVFFALPLIVLVGVVATVISASAGNGNARDDDAKTIQGTWGIASAEIGGVGFPPEVARIITLKIDHGKYEVKAENFDRGTYTIDPTARPKILDIYGVEGPNAGKHFPCIYELHGDMLRVCYQLGDGPRPRKFESPAGSKIFLVTYKRKAE